MTGTEFLQVSALDKPALHKLLAGQSFDTAMTFRREIQQGLTRYARGKGARAEYDHVQTGALEVLRVIESWCREAFYRRRLPEILRQEGNLVLRGKKEAKWQVRKEWETLVAKRAY